LDLPTPDVRYLTFGSAGAPLPLRRSDGGVDRLRKRGPTGFGGRWLRGGTFNVATAKL
jgi:hypothetical protein